MGGTGARSEKIQHYINKLPSLKAILYEEIVTEICHMVDDTILKSSNAAVKHTLSQSDPPLFTPGRLVGIGSLFMAERIKFFLEAIDIWEELQSEDYNEYTDTDKNLGQISADVRAAISRQQQPPHVVGPQTTALPTMQSSEEPTGPGIEARNVIQQLPLDPALTEYPTTAVPTANDYPSPAHQSINSSLWIPAAPSINLLSTPRLGTRIVVRKSTICLCLRSSNMNTRVQIAKTQQSSRTLSTGMLLLLGRISNLSVG